MIMKGDGRNLIEPDPAEIIKSQAAGVGKVWIYFQSLRPGQARIHGLDRRHRRDLIPAAGTHQHRYPQLGCKLPGIEVVERAQGLLVVAARLIQQLFYE